MNDSIIKYFSNKLWTQFIWKVNIKQYNLNIQNIIFSYNNIYNYIYFNIFSFIYYFNQEFYNFYNS